MRQAGFRIPLATITVVASCCMLFSSCGKKHHAKPENSGASPVSDEDSLKYLMYRTMQASFVDGGRDQSTDLPTYYWYDQVPELNPFSSSYPDADALLAIMTGYPVNPATGGSIDRYSFLDRTGAVSDEIQNGVVDGVFADLGSAGSLGMDAIYTEDQQGKSHLIILYADKNSPAGLLGIGRGWEVIAIGGDTAVSYDGPDGPNVVRASNAIYGSTGASFRFFTLRGKTVEYAVTPESYKINPILFDTIYHWDGRKVGYFAFYTFASTRDEQGNATLTQTKLDEEFNKLATSGISDLIVDLRYNGGGSVLTAEYLTNAIAPASLKGNLMYRYLYNDKLSKRPDLLGLSSAVYFPGGGNLSLQRVFFITSRSTASASELVINNLRPYMKAYLVGDTTFGKPVGFINFDLSVYDSTGASHHLADLYAIDFETLNSQGQGGYFQGIPPDAAAGDDLQYGWGNPADENLVQIRHFLSSGTFLRAGNLRRSGVRPSTLLRGSLPSGRFQGMVDYRLSRQLQPPRSR